MAKLVINPTSASKKEIPLAARVISIGRDPSNDLVLSDSMVSRRHAILEQRDDQYVLRDNHSSNGTLVNGDRVREEKMLRDGDLVAIGSSRLLFQLDDTAEASLADVSSRNDGSASSRGAEAGARRCPHCGRAAQSSDRFCRGCGAGLDGGWQSTSCPFCGTEVPLPADYCGSCGRGLSPAARSGETDPQEPLAANLRIEEVSSPSGGLPRPGPAVRGRAPSYAASAEPAGFAVRLVAALVDAMVLGIPVLVAALVWATLSMDDAPAPASGADSSGAVLPVAGFVLFAFLYFFLFWAFRGTTPGGALLGLVVRSEAGRTPPGIGRAAVRALVGFLGLLPLGLGYLWIAFSDDGMGLHDRVSRTRVTRLP